MTGKELKPTNPSDEAVRRIAMDVGKDLVEYIECVYPEMTTAVRSWKATRTSLRNHVYNAIMAMVRAADEGRDQEAIACHEKHRRVMRKLRKAKTVEEVIAATR